MSMKLIAKIAVLCLVTLSVRADTYFSNASTNAFSGGAAAVSALSGTSPAYISHWQTVCITGGPCNSQMFDSPNHRWVYASSLDLVAACGPGKFVGASTHHYFAVLAENGTDYSIGSASCDELPH